MKNSRMGRSSKETLFEIEAEQQECSHVISVAFEAGADTTFSYFVSDELWPVEAGARVEAPFGRRNKPQMGFCVESAGERPRGVRLKAIKRKIDAKPFVSTFTFDECPQVFERLISGESGLIKAVLIGNEG